MNRTNAEPDEPVAAGARTSRPRDRREQILEAAAQLFGERGFHAVGIDDIGRAVGITGAAVYRHFANKEDIVMAAIDRNLSRLLASMDEVLADMTEGDTLTPMIEQMVASELRDWDFALVWRRESRSLPRTRRNELLPVRRKIAARLNEQYAKVQPDLTDTDRRMRLAAHQGLVSGVLLHGTRTERRRHRGLVTAATLHCLRLPDVPRVVAREPPLVPISKVRRASRREVVLAAATELFAERGFRSVGIDDAGAHAGMAGPSVYRHFESKDAILAEATRRAGSALDVLLASVFSMALSPDQRLDALSRGLVELAYDLPDNLVLFFYEAHNLLADDKERYEQTVDRLFTEWALVLEAARPELSAAAARTLVHAVVGCCVSVVAANEVRRLDFRAALHTIIASVQREVPASSRPRRGQAATNPPIEEAAGVTPARPRRSSRGA